MKFAYADPPYVGCSKLYKNEPEYDGEIDHQELIDNLVEEFPDGWALSCTSPSLKQLLAMCPEYVRVAAWVKPMASFKPNINPAYTWEPVIWTGGRKRDRYEDTVRDWVSANITIKKGLTGAKPRGFCVWLMNLLNVHPEDQLVDLFPGTNSLTDVFKAYVLGKAPQEDLFYETPTEEK